MEPLPVVDKQLRTLEKKENMNERIVSEYRAIVKASLLPAAASVFVDPTHVCNHDQQVKSTDGVHYTRSVYDVLSQVMVNGWKSFLLDRQGNTLRPVTSTTDALYVPKPTGSMRNTELGLVVVLSIMIMLLTMDNFFGTGTLSLLAMTCGRVSLSWRDAYGPILKKMDIPLPGTQAKHDPEVDKLLTESTSSMANVTTSA